MQHFVHASHPSSLSFAAGSSFPLIIPLLLLGSSPAEGKEMPCISAKGSQGLLESMYGVNCSKCKVWLCLASSGTDRGFIKRALELGKQPNTSHSLC